MRREDIKHIIEAVMFAYAEPISIKELNDIEFELYKKSLTSEFIEKLKQENFTDYRIGGVI